MARASAASGVCGGWIVMVLGGKRRQACGLWPGRLLPASLGDLPMRTNILSGPGCSRRALLRGALHAAALAAPFAPRASAAAPLPRSDASTAGWSAAKLDEA